MSEATDLTKVESRILPSVHLDALHDLISAYDADHACAAILRQIAALSGCTSSFISLNLPDALTEDSRAFASASTGFIFNGVSTYQESVEELAHYGWANLNEPFSQVLPNTETFRELTFTGYPLFDQLGRLAGSFAVITNSPTSLQVINQYCSLMLVMLTHRVHEFQFLGIPHVNENAELVLQVSRRGVHFPSLSNTYAQSAHGVNGQLAISSLQAQILTNSDVTDETIRRGLERITGAIARTGILLHRQEDAIGLLMNQSEYSHLTSSINMAIASYNQMMTYKIPLELKLNQEKETLIALPGNAAFWLFHNLFRSIAAIYQWLPIPDKNINAIFSTINHESTDQKFTKLVIHIPFNSQIMDLINEFYSTKVSFLSGEKLPNMLSSMNEFMLLLNCEIGIQATDREILLQVVIPNRGD
jgi:hypothetical protein